jgi:acetoin:2,6-dichlorophenolindophenol oxidoreductase subunit alpha
MAESWEVERKQRVLETMLTIRRFEETIVRLFQEEAFMAHYHLYIGQEATGVAVMEALGADDRIATHHRNHGHLIARGADPGRAVAEILGRETGLNGGQGGTLHMSDPDLGFLSTSSIVGGSISLATGAGFALRQQGGDAVSVGLFGDGALEEGVSYETLNFAALWSLPVVYICENNSPGALGSAGGGFPTSVSSVKELTTIPETFGIPVETVDGRDVDAVYELTCRAVDHCRRREGPFFIHALTDRYAGSQGLWPDLPTGQTDISMGWDESRMEGEHQGWYHGHDPVMIYARRLLGDGDITQDELAEMDRRVTERLEKAREFALESPLPAPETALDNVFV